MNDITPQVPLGETPREPGLVKTCAFCVFRAARAVVREARAVRQDVVEAWRESALDH